MSANYETTERFVIDEVTTLAGDDAGPITADTPLIGHGRVLDSADLVVLLLAVEDYAREQFGFEWDWASDSAMSEARSVLRNIGSLANHLIAVAGD